MDLLPTQIEDAAYLAASPSGNRGSLFSEPGTGKTLTVLEAARLLKPKRGLIVAPPIALRMWKTNIEDYLGAKAQVIRSGKDVVDYTADFHVITYAMASEFPELKGADVLALDEADALKTLSSVRTKAIYGTRASGNNCLIHKAGAVFPMTGTPIRRYADDLYPWMKALHPRVTRAYGLTTLEKFQEAFCFSQMRRYNMRMPAKRVVIGNRNEERLRAIIENERLAVRRTMEDVAPYMPELRERVIGVGYEDSQALREASAMLVDEPDQEATMTTARRLLGIAKAKDCADYLLDCNDDKQGPILVLFWHKEVRQAVIDLLMKEDLFNIRTIDGSTPTRLREQYEDEFNNGSVDFLFGQIQSMGVALNLQRGSNRAVFIERDWSPSSQEQGYKRIWRLGQKAKVLVDYCIADHPIDEAVTMVNERKLKSNKTILDLGRR